MANSNNMGKAFPLQVKDITDAITLLQKNFREKMFIPSHLLLANDKAQSVQEVMLRQVEGADRINALTQQSIQPFMSGLKIITSKFMPKHYECVGHEFNNPPPSRNRSLRVWKKLRYGTKHRRLVKPIMVEVEYAYIFDDSIIRQKMAIEIDDLIERSYKIHSVI